MTTPKLTDVREGTCDCWTVPEIKVCQRCQECGKDKPPKLTEAQRIPCNAEKGHVFVDATVMCELESGHQGAHVFPPLPVRLMGAALTRDEVAPDDGPLTEAGRKAVGKPWLHVGLPGAKPMPVHQLDEADAAQKRLEAKKESHG